ncbi:flavonol synthase/flavanone 3-hydroxylase [Macadamia integrifolia]|uniref:flavonol synthase/flavanone 3-hydroxylase n=1 Tax=Macadamia integrifolia TaxID=60698 RepID=UPI001C4F3FB7|nr:flavonol synthase/flavanone 3-hydroxylase [Macadamia integrifolia]
MEKGRVQAIASQAIATDTIPEEFIRAKEEQPAATTYNGPVPQIPTVDLSEPNKDNLVCSIASASEEWGIFQVVNHGIPVEVIQKLQKVGKEFFELPEEEKEAYSSVPGSIEGYGTKLQKEQGGKRAWVDFLFHNIWPPSVINYQFWPKNPIAYREANEEYAKYLRAMVEKLLRFLSLGLGLEGNAIREAMGGDELEYLLKINYYPPCPRPDLALGVVAHTDMSAITVLVPNEVPGLQIFKDDHWIDANYIRNALIIHIGDQTEILSNGKYKSVLHRTTVNKEKTRISWPVFCSPPREMVVGPLHQLTNEQNPPKYKSKKFKDYEYCKLNKLPQ